MSNRAIATKLVLESLDQSTNINSIYDRTRIQKVIYLAQAAGIPLGYGYSWYLKGPYSTSLAEDYYNFPNSVGENSLKQQLLNKLEPVGNIINDQRKPEQLRLDQWLELIASVHYLKFTSKLDTDKITKKIESQKPNLLGHLNIADEIINEYFQVEAV